MHLSWVWRGGCAMSHGQSSRWVVGSFTPDLPLTLVSVLYSFFLQNPKCPSLSQELKFYISSWPHLKICLLPILIPLHSTFSLLINYSNLCYIIIHSIPPYICIFIILLLCRYFFHYLVFLAEQGDLQGKEDCLGFSCLSAPHRP